MLDIFRLFDEVDLGIDSRTPELKNSASSAMQEVLDIINSFAKSRAFGMEFEEVFLEYAHHRTITHLGARSSDGKLSLMSPRLFSLFPETSKSTGRRLLSPTIFSFQKDGYLSLPELFDMITSDQRYQQLLLDVILDVSGAGSALEELLVRIKSEIDETKNIQLPIVENLQRKNREWTQARSTFDDEQRMDYERNGYAFMKEEQLRLVYEQRDQLRHGINVTELGSMSKEEKVSRLEKDIRALAFLDQPKWPLWGKAETYRRRRQAAEENAEAGHDGDIDFATLRPAAFVALLGQGAALEVITLSPHAFLSEIMYPTAVGVETLSPRAFVASILSPNALIARILSPTAFRVEVLSPRALHTWVLSPEVFLAEILSPRFLDPRVASPQALVFEVLSPGIISPHIQSSETASLIVLSPNILSPRIQSEEKMVVEILSPHILGGSHSHEEETKEVSEVGAHSPLDHEHGENGEPIDIQNHVNGHHQHPRW